MGKITLVVQPTGSSYMQTLARKMTASGVPRVAHFQLTYRCNFRCVHCYCIHDAPGRELDTGEWRDALDQLAELGCPDVVLTGGETFLRRDALEIARHARARRFNVTLFTNGYLIDARMADAIAALNVWQVAITLYGASEPVHRQVTQVPGALFRVRQAVDLLLDRGVRVKLRAPLLRQLAGEAQDLLDYARERGRQLRFCPRMTPRDDGDPAPLQHQLPPDELARFFERHVRVRPPRHAPDAAPCGAGRTMLVVTPFGDVLACMQVRRPLGNLRRRPLTEIWRGPDPLLGALRRMRNADFVLPGGAPAHTPLCAGINLMESGDPLRVAPQSHLVRFGALLAGAPREPGR